MFIFYTYVCLTMCEWVCLFLLSYAPWCPACQQFESEWVQFAYRSADYNVNVAKVDIAVQTSAYMCLTSLACGSCG